MVSTPGRFYILIFFFSLTNIMAAAENDTTLKIDTNIEERIIAPLLLDSASSEEDKELFSDTIYVPKKRKLKAVLLSVLLGHFGVHRIYLGTKANVPVAYSLTLGGGLGLLPLIDTIMILQSKDLEEFSNNDKVIMWSKQKSTQP